MKDLNIKRLMTTLKGNAGFMEYLPGVFYKKDPPAEFFWPVYSTVCSEDFRRKYVACKDRIIRKIKKPLTVFVTSDAKRRLEVQREETLSTLNALRRPGLNANIIYLRKTEKRRDPGPQGQAPVVQNTPTPARNSLRQERPTNSPVN